MTGEDDFPCGGIDAGLHGALAIIKGDRCEVWDTPIVEVGKATGGVKHVYLEAEMLRLLRDLKHGYPGRGVAIALETFQPRPGQSSIATGHMGVGWGLWRMAIQAAHLTYHPMAAVTWSARVFKDTGLVVPKKGTVTEAKRDDIRKTNSRILAGRLYPQDAGLFRRKSDHDRAEAVLIGHYLRGRLLGHWQ